MYPGTISFERFEYPSSLPESVQQRMARVAERVMRRIGYDNGMFNIEMFYNSKKDLIQIVEINPRLVGQFADLMEKVNGTNTYEIMLALAAGEKPIVKKRKGRFKVAASFVLRSFEDKKVTGMPGPEQVEEVKRLFPETLLHTFYEEGERMSDYEHMDDVESYSYAMINMGAADRGSLMAAFDEAKKRLAFSFADLD
jgi:biotin carboxylase